MPESNKIDERFRAQADQLKPIAVSWSEVEEHLRYRRRLRLMVLIAITIGLTVAMASALLAARTALDPTFEPPIFSRASTSTQVREPPLGRGLITKAEFLRGAGGTATTSAAGASRRGFPLAAKVKTTDLRGKELIARWRLRPVGHRARWHQTQDYRVARLVAGSGTGVHRVRVWAPAPHHSGRYVAEVVLVSPEQGVVEHSKSRPFEVVGGDCCVPYLAPTYTAVLPRGWRITSDYERAPGGRFVSEADGPGGAVLIIDTTPHSSGNALASERMLAGLLADSDDGYRRMGVKETRGREGEMVEWTYRAEGKADTDELFYRGGSGYGIRGESPPEHFRETREFCRAVERALRSK